MADSRRFIAIASNAIGPSELLRHGTPNVAMQQKVSLRCARKRADHA
jgi:hypothetical protein